MRGTYESLAARLEELSRLGGVMGILHWDQEVIMPEGATEARAKQISALAGIVHDKATAPEIGEWLAKLLANDSSSRFDSFETCNIREAKRDYDRMTKIPKALVQEMAELSSRGHAVWALARKDDQYDDFAPVLKRFVELKIQWARCIDPEKPPYDVNIDYYERGMTMARLDPIFERLKAEIVP
ncbi:MAG: carboxypeptidase M32, partial [Nitrospinales bacterium]